MHLQITFRDNREPLIASFVEVDTGQAFWTAFGDAGDSEGNPKSGQIRLEEIKQITPFTFYPDNGEGVTN